MSEFKYIQPKSLSSASGFLKDKTKNAIVYAGGTDALALIKDKIYNPSNVVNIKNIPGIDKIEYQSRQGLTIGTLAKIDDVINSTVIKNNYNVLYEAAKEIATPQLRNMGTVGGNLCQRPRCWYYRGDFNCIKKGGDECYAYQGENKYHCIIGGGPCFIVHPSDLAVALLALNAEVSIYSNGETRSIPIKELFILPEEDYLKENILKPGEIVTKISVPFLENNSVSSYLKMKERGTWDFAVVSIASVIKRRGNQITEGKIAFGGIAPKPWEDESLNKNLSGLKLTEKNIESLSQSILQKAEPLEKNGYKLLLAKNLVKKTLTNLMN
jgi:xanthine dehydrogenase YagS FAD-binding subunit